MSGLMAMTVVLLAMNIYIYKGRIPEVKPLRLQVWEKKGGMEEEEAVMKVHEGEKERKKERGKKDKRQPPP